MLESDVSKVKVLVLLSIEANVGAPIKVYVSTASLQTTLLLLVTVLCVYIKVLGPVPT